MLAQDLYKPCGRKRGGRRRLVQDGQEVAGVDRGQDPGGDDPTEEAADEPIDFPGPFLDAAIGNVETAQGQAAQPMENHAAERIDDHHLS